MTKDGDKKSKAELVVQSIQEKIKTNPGLQRHLTVFKALLSEIPGGGAFIYLLDDHIAAKKEERIIKFMEETVQAIAQVNDRIDQEKLKTDHYAFIFEECLRGVARHPQKEKIDSYKAILINAAVPSTISDDEQEYFLNLVNTLSPVHIRLIAALNEARKIPQGGGRESGFKLRTHLGNTSSEILMSAAAELYQLQFTNTEPRSIPFDADMSRVGGRLTPIAMKFIEFCTL
ncbi:MAG: hypothetical protein HOO67_07205 [Candidatus Peribacteraceae bacterium]|nr:hypothetical protein [Candidatus Peribacteraceae bacterium]